MSQSSFTLRQATLQDIPTAVDVWHRAVLATHTFLPDGVVDGLHARLATDFLPNVELWVGVDHEDRVVGFVGLSGSHVEMLFVDPAVHGCGLGSALLHHAAGLSAGDEITVDVNEQNPRALVFYERRGFRRTGRSPVDGDGMPFPLVHLALAGTTSE